MSEPKRAPNTALTNPFSSPTEGYCEILFVRHGEQAYREKMVLEDAINPPLTELGIRQAEAVGKRLAPRNVAAVYASPYERAHHTGQAIAEHQGAPPVVIDDLREVDLWSKLPQDKTLVEAVGVDELREIFAAVSTDRSWDSYRYGEGSVSFRTRVAAAVDGLVEQHLGERIVVACHGGIIATVLAMAMDSPRDYGIGVHHSSITTIRAADVRRAIHRVNDYDHVLDFQTSLNPLNLH